MTWTDWYQYGLMDKQFVAYLALPCKLGCDWSLNIFHWQILYWYYWVFKKCKFTKIWQSSVTKFCIGHRILFWSISTTSEVTNVRYIYLLQPVIFQEYLQCIDNQTQKSKFTCMTQTNTFHRARFQIGIDLRTRCQINVDDSMTINRILGRSTLMFSFYFMY